MARPLLPLQEVEGAASCEDDRVVALALLLRPQQLPQVRPLQVSRLLLLLKQVQAWPVCALQGDEVRRHALQLASLRASRRAQADLAA